MKKAFFQLHRTKRNTLIIYFLCIISAFVKLKLSEHFRGTWIYPFMSLSSLIVFYGSIFWSIVNGITMYKEIKSKTKYDFLWIIINYIPFLYLFTMFFIVCLKDY